MDTTKKIQPKNLLRALALLIALPILAVADVEQNTINSYHAPISHCYHWLSEKSRGYLSAKYRFANNNHGSITFYTSPGTSNGAVAGPGLYCAKSPVGSYNYGDRVIRLDFVDDIVLYDAKSGKKHCGLDGNYYPTQAECDKKPWDIKFFNGGGKGNSAWYVIRDPQAVAQWSGNSTQVESDLLLNKKFSNSAFQAHADQTIAAMAKERGIMGDLTVINHKARMNLLDILNDPEEIKEIPPLNLIARVLRYPGNDISSSKKDEIYSEQALRALNDIYLELVDIQDAIKSEPKLKPVFTKAAIDVLSSKDLHKANVVAVYLLLRETSPQTLDDAALAKIWSAIFKSDNFFAALPDAKIDGATEIDAFFNSLPAMTELDKLDIQNQFALLKLLNQMADTAPRTQVAKVYVQHIWTTYISSHIEYFQQAYAAVDNNLLEKEEILLSIFDGLSHSAFAGLDPVYLGTILEDNLSAKLDPTTAADYQNDIANLSLPMTQEETYKIMGKFAQGQIKLPSFITTETFLTMLFDRALAEQTQLATPTNTFRFILSGYYEYFHNNFVKAKDDAAKAAARNQAESFFLSLAQRLSGPLELAYTYPILQNASYFSVDSDPANLNYDGHPMARYLKRYNQGDANFDAMLEQFTGASLDGSYLHYLSYMGLDRKDPNALNLLGLMLETLTGDTFKNFKATPEYALSNGEKETWHNYIFNRHIANAGRNRAKSDFCGISQTLNKYESKISSFVGATAALEAQAIIAEGKQNKCF